MSADLGICKKRYFCGGKIALMPVHIWVIATIDPGFLVVTTDARNRKKLFESWGLSLLV